jgi:hypothetical protein
LVSNRPEPTVMLSWACRITDGPWSVGTTSLGAVVLFDG